MTSALHFQSLPAGVGGTDWRALAWKLEVPAGDDGGRDPGGNWWGEEDLVK